jgi:hypothetical protein
MNKLSELGLGRNQFFDFSELVVELEAFLVGQRVRRLDDLARDNLFDGELNFLEVDSRLQIDKLARLEGTRLRKRKPRLTGISGVSKTYFGTQRLPTSCAIASLTLPTSSCVNLTPGFISKNSSTRSSSSSGLLCPTHTLSWISSGNRASSTLYTSALPNRTPEGFSTPSARPWRWICFVAGSMEMKSGRGC